MIRWRGLKKLSVEYVVEATSGRLQWKDQVELYSNAVAYAETRMRIITVSLLLVFGAFFILDMGRFLMETFGLPRSLSWLAGGLVIVVFLVLALQLRGRMHHHFRVHLQRRLASMRIRPHFCILCEYNLEGSESLLCPECGARLAALSAEQLDQTD